MSVRLALIRDSHSVAFQRMIKFYDKIVANREREGPQSKCPFYVQFAQLIATKLMESLAAAAGSAWLNALSSYLLEEKWKQRKSHIRGVGAIKCLQEVERNLMQHINTRARSGSHRPVKILLLKRRDFTSNIPLQGAH